VEKPYRKRGDNCDRVFPGASGRGGNLCRGGGQGEDIKGKHADKGRRLVRSTDPLGVTKRRSRWRTKEAECHVSKTKGGHWFAKDRPRWIN